MIIRQGILFVLDRRMFREDIDIKIKQLEVDLEKETEKYMTVLSHMRIIQHYEAFGIICMRLNYNWKRCILNLK